jgi:hypothetical protein
LDVRGGSIASHIRWTERVSSPPPCLLSRRQLHFCSGPPCNRATGLLGFSFRLHTRTKSSTGGRYNKPSSRAVESRNQRIAQIAEGVGIENVLYEEKTGGVVDEIAKIVEQAHYGSRMRLDNNHLGVVIVELIAERQKEIAR